MAKLSVEMMLVVVLGIMWCSVSVPPTSAQSDGFCWNEINKCIVDHVGRSLIEPKYNPTSPSFNMTEFLCCPLMVQTAQTNRECFCVIDTGVHQDPSLASNVTSFLSLCSIVDSIASLDNFCLGIAPTAAEAPMIPMVEAPMMSVMPPL